MDDNVHMEPNCVSSCLGGNSADACLMDSGSNGYKDVRYDESWCPSHILDFSDLSVGECFSIYWFPYDPEVLFSVS